ncbi:cytochrome P450 [Pseudarthrobacter sp. R1]|uniref:cytochrome P450 n=1 Tax=Pseudarthrobacter sp. R1 TaxID=2944934 RepID=UPI0021092606|nr:cytochrome P450 [Pseudarthrobacter sp. R1]MCQ6271180.1 cytochrome P450 [Pseudarthrobacter sp. R1]
MTARLPDSSLALLREGYTFISARCDEAGTDLIQTRLMLRPVVCIRGAAAAEFFYGGGKFSRTGALPRSVKHLLQDAGSVQTLEGDAHHRRKQLFLDLGSRGSAERLADYFDAEWHDPDHGLPSGRRFNLHIEIRRILTAAACRWAGLPADPPTIRRRSRELGLMIDQAGSFGPVNWYARWRRRSTEKWAANAILAARLASPVKAPATPVEAIAFHRDNTGKELPPDTAAVELLNLLRPVVAVSNFIVFAALALTQHPEWKNKLANGDEDDLHCFAQEVRRYYPFFPFVGGTATADLEWAGHTFKPGDWVLLDLYGTNHDPRTWPNPESFDPARFRTWQPNPNTLIPQGAGDKETGHRCPGEDITVELIKRAIRALADTPALQVPAQDLSFNLSSMPALPKSGFILGPGHAGRR